MTHDVIRRSENKPGACQPRGEVQRGEIHLGDLACALATLRWQDDAQAGAIAACLGFGLKVPRTPRPVEVYNPDAQPRRPTGTTGTGACPAHARTPARVAPGPA